MLPENFYPIIGDITLSDIKTKQVILIGTCEIHRYDHYKQNDYIYIKSDYKLVGYRNESNTITISADDIPVSFKYHIHANVDNDEFNRIYISGLCRGDSEITFFTDKDDYIGCRLIPMKKVDIGKNEIKLCDINVWKE